MIIDARSIPDGTMLHADVCVVGSGIAAMVLVPSLERAGVSVLVLEAGGFRPERSLDDAQRGTTEGADHEDLERVSARRLGGTLALWGGRLAPLDPEDFACRPERGGSWPLGRDSLDPWYRLAHSSLRGGAYEYRAAAALRDAEPLLPQDGEPLSMEEKIWRWSPPLRFRHFTKQLAASSRIRLCHNALVTRLCQDENGVVTHAEISKDRAHRFSVTASVFVVAGGGLQSTRLLLASGRPGGRGLGNEHGHAGRNYMTHPVADAGRLVVDPQAAARLCSFQRTVDGVYARRFVTIRPEVRAEHGLLNLNMALFGPDPHDPSHGDGLLSAYALAKHFLLSRGLTDKTAGVHRFNAGRPLLLSPHLRNLVLTAPGTTRQLAVWSRRRWLQERQIPALLSPGRSGVLRLRFDAEQRPDVSNRVELLRDCDEFGMPRMRLHYRVTQQDRDSYYRSLLIVQADISRLGVGVLHLPDRDRFAEMPLGNGTHQLGLLRMSAAPSDGVVDADCRVHSSPNTYVLSTAVFPTAGAAPPTLTLAALALRLADTLGRRLAGRATRFSALDPTTEVAAPPSGC